MRKMVQQYLDAVREPKVAIEAAEKNIADARRRLDEYCIDGVTRLMQAQAAGYRIPFVHLGNHSEPDEREGKIRWNYYMQEGRLEKLTTEGIGGINIKTITLEDMQFHELGEGEILGVASSIEKALEDVSQ